MKRSLLAALSALLGVLALAGCPGPIERPSPEAPATQPATPAAPAPAQPATPAPAPRAPQVDATPQRSPVPARTPLDAYKQAMAGQILKVNQTRTFEGRPPHFLKAVVVLQIAVDDRGQPTRVNVMRTPDHARHLGKVAVDTVRRAGPYGAPSRDLLAGKRELVFTETWLFRDDERFQIRSLALEQ